MGGEDRKNFKNPKAGSLKKVTNRLTYTRRKEGMEEKEGGTERGGAGTTERMHKQTLLGRWKHKTFIY